MKGLPDRLYTPKHIVIARIILFIVLYCYTFNVLGFSQTHHRNLKQISGVIRFQEGEELSKHARIVIQLLDVSIADATSVKISEEIMEDVNEIPSMLPLLSSPVYTSFVPLFFSLPTVVFRKHLIYSDVH